MIEIISSEAEQGDHVIEIWRAVVDATHDCRSPEDRQALDREVCALLPQALRWLAR